MPQSTVSERATALREQAAQVRLISQQVADPDVEIALRAYAQILEAQVVLCGKDPL
jgi:hypothetical protein